MAEDGRRDAAGASGAVRVGTGEGGRALATGDYMPEVRRRLLAAWVAWGARLRRGPGAPPTRRGVGPTLTYRGEARTTAQAINYTHLLRRLVLSPVQRRSGGLPPRPPGPLRVLELLAEGLAKRSPSSMLCNTTSSQTSGARRSQRTCGEAAQRGLAPGHRSAARGRAVASAAARAVAAQSVTAAARTAPR